MELAAQADEAVEGGFESLLADSGSNRFFHPQKSPNLNMTLFFHISQSKCFYGAGRLTMVANRAHLNLFARSTVSFEALR